MSTQRWLRFLPGRPHLLLFIGVGVLIVFAVGFANLALMRQDLQQRYERAATRVERLQEQNARLQQDLNREQQGQHLPDRAWQYYGQVPPGAGVVILEPDPASQATTDAARPTGPRPFWADLWERLTRP